MTLPSDFSLADLLYSIGSAIVGYFAGLFHGKSKNG